MDLKDDRKDLVRTLNKLIENCKDGEAGFKACAEDIKRPDIKELFTQRSRQCGEAAAELQRTVLELGGDPEDSTSVSGDLHRRWVDLKSMITGKDDEAILNECERGEDVAVRAYRKALEKPLPPSVQAVVEKQFQGVQRNHDQVRALRNQVRKAS